MEKVTTQKGIVRRKIGRGNGKIDTATNLTERRSTKLYSHQNLT